jgi:5-methyltetrahydrofolate--homocysteine methyltransferase
MEDEMDSFPFKLPLILDGATGTQLMAAGKPEGVCGELWNLEHPEVLTAIQKAYAELERQGIIAALPGRGSIILSGSGAVADAGREDLLEELEPLAQKAAALHMTEEEFLTLAAKCWRSAQDKNGKERGV